MAIHAAEAEAQDIEAKIADAAITTEALARQIFGDVAYLVRDTDIDRETGDEETVFEVHYCFDDPENGFDRLTELHEAFTSAFVRAIDPEAFSRVVLDAVPTEADSLERLLRRSTTQRRGARWRSMLLKLTASGKRSTKLQSRRRHSRGSSSGMRRT